MTVRPLHLLHRSSLANSQISRSEHHSHDEGGGLVLSAALGGVIAAVLAVVISGPMTMLVQRQQANAAADATALAVLWWGDSIAHQISQSNGAEIVQLDVTNVQGGRRSTVVVQVGQVRARAAASDA